MDEVHPIIILIDSARFPSYVVLISRICDGIVSELSSGPKKGTRGSHGPPLKKGNKNLGGAQIIFTRLKNYQFN